jgi:aspartate aminotransferase
MKWPADRIANSSPKSFGMYEKAAKLSANGVDVLHLEVGRPSFDTPSHIKDAVKQALDRGQVHYGDFAGDLTLRKAIVEKVKRKNGLDVSVDEVLVTNALTHASYAVIMAAIDPGDEVILLEPYYPQHISKIELAGGVVVTAQLDQQTEFRINPTAIVNAITPRTRMICLVNPANPTGRVYGLEELQALADIAIKHDLLVLSDEVYDEILYDGTQHISIASLPGMFERTFSLFAFTKAYAMDGWRLGYAVAHQKFMKGVMEITVNDGGHVNSFIQAGGGAALTGGDDCLHEMIAEDKRRRDMVCQRLNQMPGVQCPVPEGTIYAFPDISATGKKSQQIADELLEKVHVVVESGTFYGPSGEGYLRICFGAEPFDRIDEGLNLIAHYFNEIAI